MTHRIGTIDVGTNSVLLLVSEAFESEVRPLADRATITRLGRGVAKTGILDRRSIEATLAVLEEYRREAGACGASEILAVGTSALRDATNGRDFLEPARAILGCEVEVISGRREAELTYWGARVGLDLGDREEVTLFDVGGGSTELATGRGATLERTQSLDIGAVRLHERHLGSDPPTHEEMAALATDVRSHLEASPIRARGALVGIAGTVTTLAAMTLGLSTYERQKVHGLTLQRSEVAALGERLRRMPFEERRGLPGLDPGRADVIVAGAALVSELLAWAGAETVTVSDGGIRYGLALEALNIRGG